MAHKLPSGRHGRVVTSYFFLLPCWCLVAGRDLVASVGSSFPGRATTTFPTAPAVFSFTTSDNDFYERFQVELRVIFLESPSYGHMASLSDTPLSSCHDLLAEVSDVFPSPLNCYSGNFSESSQDQRFFGIRFSPLRTLKRRHSYKFVVPKFQLLQGGDSIGQRANFRWLFEFRLPTGELMESTTATLSNDVLAQLDSSYLTEFFVRGGQDMNPGSLHQLLLVFDLMHLPPSGQIMVTFFPMLLWDQRRSVCVPVLGSFASSCRYKRAAPDLGYNQLLIQPLGNESLIGTFSFYANLLIPEDLGFLSTEVSAAVLLESQAFGPFFEGSGSSTPPPLELNSRMPPTAKIISVSNRMEGSDDNGVTILIKPQATMRGVNLKGEPRRVSLSITASAFFVINGAASVATTSALGTDRTPLLLISSDRRMVTFLLHSKSSLVIGSVEYTVRLFVTNPLRFFWEVTANDPWTVAIDQGPRLGCEGCPSVRYEGVFHGPPVDFAIREFQILAGSLVMGAHSSIIFTFQLIYRAERLELLLPSGVVAHACSFQSPANINFWARRFLRCAPHDSCFQVTNKPPGRPADQLPPGWTLGFEGVLQHPHDPAHGIQIWSARALGGAGEIVARTRDEEAVRLQLYPRQIANLNIDAQDYNPNVTSVVTIGFAPSVSLQPGDQIRVLAPPGFAWNFIASEFSVQPASLELDSPLPVRIPSADGTHSALSLHIVGAMAAQQKYGFSAQISHPDSEPVDYHWTLETFGPGAATLHDRRYESGSLKAYNLSLLVNVKVSPWTQVISATGPVTLSFTTTNEVKVLGMVVVRSPLDFSFSPTCSVSSLQLNPSTFGSTIVVPPTSMDCNVITPNEVHLLLTSGDPDGFRGLKAGVSYAITVHSLKNAAEDSWEAALSQWQVETLDASQFTLDSAATVDGYTVAYELPYAEFWLGGPSIGADTRVGVKQWVLLVFQVFAPTEPQQLLRVLAAPGFVFDDFCSVRDPPAVLGPWENVGQQLSGCRGLAAFAEVMIEAVWLRMHTYAFQIEVRNNIPSATPPSEMEAAYVTSWRLCIDGCKQMSTNLTMPKISGFQYLSILTSSNVLGDHAILVVRLILSTSMPPLSTLRIRAPNGYVFPLFCTDFASTEGGSYFAIPWATTCEGGGFGRRLSDLQGVDRRLARLQPQEVRLTLGVNRGARLLAHKPYEFTVGIRNPDRENWPVNLAWELSTATSSEELLDFTRTEDEAPATGYLMSPMQNVYFLVASQYANVQHSIHFAFRPVRAREGGDEDIIRHVRRLEVYAPQDLDNPDQALSSQWDLSNPSACASPFVMPNGVQVVGLQHGNITTIDGIVICFVEGSQALSLTFEPSAVSVELPITLDFAVRNPDKSPRALWNRWRVKLFRIRPSVLEDAASRDTMALAAQGVFFMPICEANFPGFMVIRTFERVHLHPSEYATNMTSLVSFELTSRRDVQHGSIVKVVAPSGFVHLRNYEAREVFSNNKHTPRLELDTTTLGLPFNEAVIEFGMPHSAEDGPIYFTLAIRNPAVPPESPRWNFELRDSKEPDSTVLERTSGFRGYDVYYHADVVGLFGSVREIGSQYNFVRITFRLPALLERGGMLQVQAPGGYELFLEGFSRDNLPPFSAPTVIEGGSPRNPAWLNISVPLGLEAKKYYAFRFGVANPPTQRRGQQQQPWELWCYDDDGAVVAANRNVPPFVLEARFQDVAVLPSSVTPLKRSNILEVRIILDSSPLTVLRTPMQHDRAFLLLELPPTFRFASELGLASDGADGNGFLCDLNMAVLGPTAFASDSAGMRISPLPPGCVCYKQSESSIGIEVQESLMLGLVYQFALEIENPLVTPEGNVWQFSTERNGGQLHLAVNVNNFAISYVDTISIVATDVRKNMMQELVVEIRPTMHIRGLSVIEVLPPPGFNLFCRYLGKSPPLGLILADTECLLRGSTLRMMLPQPLSYQPFIPSMLAGERYYFAIFCENPNASTPTANFEVRLIEEWPNSRILGLQSDIKAPALADSLEDFMISASKVAPAGEPTTISVRFKAPDNEISENANVQAILLEGPAGLKLSDGNSKPCNGFQSRVQSRGDTVLPQSVCSGVSETAVVIQLPEPLMLVSAQVGSLTYIFQLEATSPTVEVLIDSFLLALLPGPGAAPIFAMTAPGFTGQVLGLTPAQLPAGPAEYVIPVPQDIELSPGDTVFLEADRGIMVLPGSAFVASSLVIHFCVALG